MISLDLSYNNNIFVLIFEQILVSKFQKIEQDFPPSQKYEKNISDPLGRGQLTCRNTYIFRYCFQLLEGLLQD